MHGHFRQDFAKIWNPVSFEYAFMKRVDKWGVRQFRDIALGKSLRIPKNSGGVPRNPKILMKPVGSLVNLQKFPDIFVYFL